MFVLTGLGNPGPQYALNRHNIGFMVIDTIAQNYNFSPFKNKFNALTCEGTIEDHKIILCKPLTFMNLSGQSVGQLSKFYKIPSEKFYIIHDDLDINFGSIKLKKGGGNGGHNGLSSIDQYITKEYWRLRIGIGHPGDKNQVSNYVLSNFKNVEQEEVVNILSSISNNIGSLFSTEPSIWLNDLRKTLMIK